MSAEPVSVGLRIDVDTFRGTHEGIPRLVNILKRHGIKASFFMSVGPDNMGRNLYGYDILLRGTAWPGPVIGRHFPETIRMPEQEGHEVGLHAWDHFTWQADIDRMSEGKMRDHIRRGMDMLSEILGHAPDCAAVAGWRCNEQALRLKEEYRLRYASDCRGGSIFHPLVGGKALTVQIPVTLPTYDEVIGADGVTQATYNAYILDKIRPGQLNVYTIHAEAEGGALSGLFEDFLTQARARDIRFVPLGELLAGAPNPPQCPMVKRDMEGREGWLAWQGSA
jgi:undecaprenyl phosphate-alpha-L-ara4FN deformylase